MKAFFRDLRKGIDFSDIFMVCFFVLIIAGIIFGGSNKVVAVMGWAFAVMNIIFNAAIRGIYNNSRQIWENIIKSYEDNIQSYRKMIEGYRKIIEDKEMRSNKVELEVRHIGRTLH